MIIANFGNEKEKYVSGLWQYDYGQVLRIQGLNLPTAVEIHFSLEEKGGTSQTRIGVSKDGVTDVVIPDSMLENNDTNRKYTIYAFVYLTDDKSGETIRKIYMTVESRPKPEAFDRPEDAELFRKAIKAVNESAERSAESEKQAEGWAHGREDLPERAQDNAKYYSDQAKEDSIKTDADRKEVERLVESVSGIDEQVAKVEGLTKQAQSSATNAALSEQAAKESESGAAQAREGAEAAQGDAEKSAQKTAEDRTAVESAKEEILQAKADVEADRRVVEEIQKDVSQTGNTIQEAVQEGVQAIENAGIMEKQEISQAGTTQKSAVENAGVQAVEGINLAKQTAVEEVEATKTDAIDDVQAEGTTQTGNVAAEGEKQVQAVQGAAQEIVADREQIAKNTTDITDLRQNKANAIIESATGEVIKTEISSDSKLVGLNIYGKSEQVVSNGYQLFDASKLPTKSQGGATVTNNGDGSFTISGSGNLSSNFFNGYDYSKELVAQILKTLKAGNICMKQEMNVSPFPFFILRKKNGERIELSKLEKTYMLTEEVIKEIDNVSISFYANSGNAIAPGTIKPMIYQDGDGTWEPFTNGKPAPAPDNESPITNAGDKGNIELNITGKNLCRAYKKGAYLTASGVYDVNAKDYYCTELIPVKDNKNYVEGNKHNANVSDTHFFDKDKNWLGKESGNCINNKKPKTAYIAFNYYKAKELEWVQVEEGLVATPYEPYKEPQSITLTCDLPITKWDKLEKREGVWGIARQSNRKILDGTENWYEYIYYENEMLHCYFVESVKCEIGFKKSLCTHFVNIDGVWSNENGKYGTYSDHKTLPNKYFVIDKPTTEDFKAWLMQQKEAGTPVELVYKTAEETWEPLPEEMQSALNALHTNYPTTIISNDENAGMEVSYVADTKNYFLNREKAMQTQITNIQNALISQKISGGGIIRAEGSAKLPIKNLRVFGRSEQNGVPSPDAPVPIVNVGEKGNINITIDGQPQQKFSLSTPNGLPGIKVKSSGNYTDENGQQWVCDEIDLAKNKYTQRIKRKQISEEHALKKYTSTSVTKFDVFVISNFLEPAWHSRGIICNLFKKTTLLSDTVGMAHGDNSGDVYIKFPKDMGIATNEQAKQFLLQNEFCIYYELATPIETSLTQEEISAFKNLHSNYPTTVITNDENAETELTYTVDTKSYVDTKIAEVSTAIVQKGIE